MSAKFTKVASLLLEENYGSAVQRVASTFMTTGPQSLAAVVQATGIPTSKVKQCLRVLVQHNFAHYTTGPAPTSPVIYSVNPADVLPLVRYPRFLAMAQKISTEASQVLEEVVRGGQVNLSKVLYILGHTFLREKKVLTKHEKTIELVLTLNSFLQAFASLARKRYIVRSTISSTGAQATTPLDLTSAGLYTLPEFDISSIVAKLEDKDVDLETAPDVLILWKVNTTRLHNEIKNAALLQGLADMFAGFMEAPATLAILLRTGSLEEPYGEETRVISAGQISIELTKEGQVDEVANLRDHLDILVAHSHGLVSESAAGVSVNLRLGSELLLWSQLESLLLERHGPNALRIFRLIKSRKYIEQEAIGRLSMLPTKEAKQLTYTLLEDKFVMLKEMRKTYTATAAALNNKIEFCFYVDLAEIAYVLYESCYQSMSNLAIRKREEKLKCKRFTDKKERNQRIIVNMTNQGCGEEQLQEIHDLISPPERIVLTELEVTTDMLTRGVFHIDQTLFLIFNYFYYRDREAKAKPIRGAKNTRYQR